jgi:hypothetical protein
MNFLCLRSWFESKNEVPMAELSSCRCATDPDRCSASQFDHLCVCESRPEGCRYEDWDHGGACGLPLAIPPHHCSCHLNPERCRLKSSFDPYLNSIKPEDTPPHGPEKK